MILHGNNYGITLTNISQNTILSNINSKENNISIDILYQNNEILIENSYFMMNKINDLRFLGSSLLYSLKIKNSEFCKSSGMLIKKFRTIKKIGECKFELNGCKFFNYNSIFLWNKAENYLNLILKNNIFQAESFSSPITIVLSRLNYVLLENNNFNNSIINVNWQVKRLSILNNMFSGWNDKIYDLNAKYYFQVNSKNDVLIENNEFLNISRDIFDIIGNNITIRKNNFKNCRSFKNLLKITLNNSLENPKALEISENTVISSMALSMTSIIGYDYILNIFQNTINNSIFIHSTIDVYSIEINYSKVDIEENYFNNNDGGTTLLLHGDVYPKIYDNWFNNPRMIYEIKSFLPCLNNSYECTYEVIHNYFNSSYLYDRIFDGFNKGYLAEIELNDCFNDEILANENYSNKINRNRKKINIHGYYRDTIELKNQIYVEENTIIDGSLKILTNNSKIIINNGRTLVIRNSIIKDKNFHLKIEEKEFEIIEKNGYYYHRGNGTSKRIVFIFNSRFDFILKSILILCESINQQIMKGKKLSFFFFHIFNHLYLLFLESYDRLNFSKITKDLNKYAIFDCYESNDLKNCKFNRSYEGWVFIPYRICSKNDGLVIIKNIEKKNFTMSNIFTSKVSLQIHANELFVLMDSQIQMQRRPFVIFSDNFHSHINILNSKIQESEYGFSIIGNLTIVSIQNCFFNSSKRPLYISGIEEKYQIQSNKFLPMNEYKRIYRENYFPSVQENSLFFEKNHKIKISVKKTEILFIQSFYNNFYFFDENGLKIQPHFEFSKGHKFYMFFITDVTIFTLNDYESYSFQLIKEKSKLKIYKKNFFLT